MAITVKELIELLTKYEKPDDVIIWQYYTRNDFDYDENQPAPTNEEFEKIADRVEGWLWEGISDNISDAIYDLQDKKEEE
jgi:uncharacterized protein YydD (DUF2326 family)